MCGLAGVEIVGDLVKQHQQLQWHDMNLDASFLELDIASAVPPMSDIVLLKDVLADVD